MPSMKSMEERCCAWLACIAALCVGCHAREPASNTSAPVAVERRIESLDPSLAALRARFNASSGKVRFIALLSPT